MSLISIGSQCHTCHLVDFLPFTCPLCQEVYCTTHIQSHLCQPDVSLSAGPSRHTTKKAKCQLGGCERPSLEAFTGVGEGLYDVAKEIKCSGCGQAYCVGHRSQDSHSCTAPRDYNARQEALQVRKEAAKSILAKNFPSISTRTIPKPPTPRDVIRTQPSSTVVPSTASSPSTVPIKKTETKAQKVWGMHLRKLRSLAVPLGPQGDGKRYFEWGFDEGSEWVERWKAGGEFGKPLTRVFANPELPCGKILDLLEKTLPNSKTQSLRLLNLVGLPEAPRTVIPLELSQPVSLIAEGSILVLTRVSD